MKRLNEDLEQRVINAIIETAKLKKLTPKQVANGSGVSFNVYSAITNGRRATNWWPSQSKGKICDFLGIKIIAVTVIDKS